jgi:hypothetical protein
LGRLRTQGHKSVSNTPSVMAKHKWLSREGWEQNQRALCWEGAENRASRQLSDYSTEAEIAAATAKLREYWKGLGRQMRAATPQERLNLRYKRECINRYLKKISNDEIPFGPYMDICGDTFDPDGARDSVIEAAYEQRVGECINDAAWTDELRRREQLYAERPDWFDEPRSRALSDEMSR